MRFSTAVAAFACVIAVRATDFPVKVGANGFTFDPPQVTGAQPGDTVTFEFHPKNHSVTQSTFTNPCQQSPGGVNSGYLATDPTAQTFSQWQITLDNTSAPLWFFCAQVNPGVHCHSGMVFAVNPTADKTFEQFQLNANQSTKSFTDAGQPPQPSPTGQAAPAGQTNAGGAAPPAGNPPPGVAGATDGSGAAAPATTAGSVATNNIPPPAAGVTGGAAGAAATGPAGSSATRVSVGTAGLFGFAVMLGLLL